MPNDNLNEVKADMVALQTKKLGESKLDINIVDDCFKDLSIVTIFRDEDAHFLSTYLKSIPNGCEVILARTVKKHVNDNKY